MKNIPLFKVFMAETAGPEVTKVLNSGFIGQGEKVNQLEKVMQDFIGRDYVLTLNSGTSALHLAIHMLKAPANNTVDIHGVGSADAQWPGIAPDDEILCTALTCTASNFPVVTNGLTIKWVDIDPTTLNMDLDDLERKITRKTKAIIVVHWGGYPVDLDRLKQIQLKAQQMYGFKPAIIEDGAHAFGTKYKGQYLGNHGNIVMHSLQAIKHITSVDGGLLILPHKDLHKRAKLLRWYGIDRDGARRDYRCEEDIFEAGYKFHMNDVNATVGIENMKHANEIIKKHQANAAFYDEQLKEVKGVTLLTRHEGHESSFWLYSMLVDNKAGFMKYMAECGIVVSQVHERNDKHTAMRPYKTSLPTLDKTIGRLISIPVGWWVTEEERQYIVDCIKKGW